MKILTVFGTRPEAIKLYPVIRELKARNITSKICISAQHNELLNSVLDEFNIKTDYNLGVYKSCKTLSEITAKIIKDFSEVIKTERPNLVLLHGDTSTALAAAIASYYEKTPVAHVEAGLRTYDTENPFPEEFNRRVIDSISNLLFAPSRIAVRNLIGEKIEKSKIHLTGNTVFDMAKILYKKSYAHPILDWASGQKLVILTTHRRENLSALHSVYRGILSLSEKEDVRIVFPLHSNPKVRQTAERMLGSNNHIALIPPLNTTDFHNILARSALVITDSGGVQEEATYYNKPTLIIRKKTERFEGIGKNCRLVGTDETLLLSEARQILRETRKHEFAPHRSLLCPSGASKKIADVIEKEFAFYK